MNSIFKSCAILLTVALLSGCTTRYKPYSFFNGGGYSEIRTSNDCFIVSFDGSFLTSKETIVKFGMVRAAELTVKNGYSFFSVQSMIDNSKNSSEFTHPGVIISIQCFEKKPAGIATIDALAYIEYNAETPSKRPALS